MQTILFVLLGISPILIVILIASIGKQYGEYLIENNLATEEECLEQGYLGLFFIKIFGI